MEERFRTFTVLITKLYRAIRKIKSEEMEEYDLATPHVSCLYYLYKEERLTLTELTEICLEDKAILSKAIAYLEAEGLIVCDTTNKKRYKSYFTLSDTGLKIAKNLVTKVDDILEFASSDLDDRDREVMYKSLSSISHKLELYSKKYKGDE